MSTETEARASGELPPAVLNELANAAFYQKPIRQILDAYAAEHAHSAALARQVEELTQERDKARGEAHAFLQIANDANSDLRRAEAQLATARKALQTALDVMEFMGDELPQDCLGIVEVKAALASTASLNEDVNANNSKS